MLPEVLKGSLSAQKGWSQCISCGSSFELTVGRGRPRKYCLDCKPPGGFSRPAMASCRNCGSEFELFKRRGGIPRYCSLRCNRQYLYRLHQEEPEAKACALCGGAVPLDNDVTGRRVGQRKYCGPNCKNKAMEIRKKERLHASLGDAIVRQCVFCGDDFTVDPKLPGGLVQTKRYCSPQCRMQVSRDRRRAKIQGLPNERINRFEIFERDGWICGICDGPVDRNLKWPDPRCASVDHVVPITAGGSHTADNVQCSHLDCNLLANAKGFPKTRTKVAS